MGLFELQVAALGLLARPARPQGTLKSESEDTFKYLQVDKVDSNTL